MLYWCTNSGGNSGGNVPPCRSYCLCASAMPLHAYAFQPWIITLGQEPWQCHDSLFLNHEWHLYFRHNSWQHACLAGMIQSSACLSALFMTGLAFRNESWQYLLRHEPWQNLSLRHDHDKAMQCFLPCEPIRIFLTYLWVSLYLLTYLLSFLLICFT